MKVFLINSFNSSAYVKAALSLLNEIDCFLTPSEISFIIVFGGASDFSCKKINENTRYLTIKENLSDNNAFVGFERAFAMGEFRENNFRDATYIYIHDTCKVGKSFVERMNELPKPRGWVFAHTYGLYNIGICDQNFLLKRANDFKGVSVIPKDQSIQLEQGYEIENSGIKIPPLSFYTCKTLSSMTLPTIDRCDYMTLNGTGTPENRRFVSFIGALGLYKMVGCKVSFFVPIWATSSHTIQTLQDRENMVKAFSNIKIGDGKDIIGTISPWIPFVPL